jgi:hypothetical protein
MDRRQLRNLSGLLMPLLILGCVLGSPTSISPTAQVIQTEAAGLSETDSSAATETTNPTAEPEQTAAVPVDFPGPELPTWSDGLQITVLEHYWGRWSPVSHQMAGLQYTSPTTASLALHQGEVPQDAQITLASPNLAGSQLWWSPDGQTILYLGPLETDGSNEPLEDVAALWAADPVSLINKNLGTALSGREPTIFGWLNPQMAIASDYQGGGLFNIQGLSFPDGTSTHLASVPAHTIWWPSQRYLPLLGHNDTYAEMFYVVGQAPMAAPHAFEGLENTHRFPHELLQGDLDNQHFVFQTWQWNTSNMLLSWIRWEGQHPGAAITHASLLHWNVENDTVRLLAPNGIAGRYSPDTRLLAAVTLGETHLAGGDPFTPSPVIADALPVLHLADANFSTVQFSAPSIILPSEARDTIPEFIPALAFSPDNRYLAFLTPGKLEVDASGKPAGVDLIDYADIYLNIYEIPSGTLFHSLPAASWTGWFDGSSELWAPTGGKFLMMDRDENWQLLDARSGALTPLTQSGGARVTSADWNFDGSQIAFYAAVSFPDLLRVIFSTVIIGVP